MGSAPGDGNARFIWAAVGAARHRDMAFFFLDYPGGSGAHPDRLPVRPQKVIQHPEITSFGFTAGYCLQRRYVCCPVTRMAY